MEFFIDSHKSDDINENVYYINEPKLDTILKDFAHGSKFLPDRYISDVLHLPTDEYRAKLCAGIDPLNIKISGYDHIEINDHQAYSFTCFTDINSAETALSNIKSMLWHQNKKIPTVAPVSKPTF